MSHLDLWPGQESDWDSTKDLLLALHLATLATGAHSFLNVVARPTPSIGAHSFIQCAERPSTDFPGCTSTFCMVQWINPKDQNGPCRMHLPPRISGGKKGGADTWLSHHHRGGEKPTHGIFCEPLKKSSKPLSLEVGPQVLTETDIVALEASIRVAGRLVGSQIAMVRTKDILVRCRGKSKGEDGSADLCQFQVRFVPAPAPNGPGSYTCKEITPNHSCEPEVGEPSKELKAILDFFPPITLKAGVIGKPKLQTSRAITKRRDVRAQHQAIFEDESDDDAAMSDDALERLCADLITICPPGPAFVVKEEAPEPAPTKGKKRARAASVASSGSAVDEKPTVTKKSRGANLDSEKPGGESAPKKKKAPAPRKSAATVDDADDESVPTAPKKKVAVKKELAGEGPSGGAASTSKKPAAKKVKTNDSEKPPKPKQTASGALAKVKSEAPSAAKKATASKGKNPPPPKDPNFKGPLSHFLVKNQQPNGKNGASASGSSSPAAAVKIDDDDDGSELSELSDSD